MTTYTFPALRLTVDVVRRYDGTYAIYNADNGAYLGWVQKDDGRPVATRWRATIARIQTHHRSRTDAVKSVAHLSEGRDKRPGSTHQETNR